MRTVGSKYLSILRVFAAAVLIYGPAAPAQDAGDTDTGPSSGQRAAEESESERRVRRLGDVGGEEFELDLSVPDAPSDGGSRSADLELPEPGQNARLQRLLSRLAVQPGDSGALAELDELLGAVLSDAHALADAGELDDMEQLLRVVRHVNPSRAGLDEAWLRYRNLRNVRDWLAAGDTALKRNQLVEPARHSAEHYYRLVLEADPENIRAGEGLQNVQLGLVERALTAARDFDFELADEWLEAAAAVHEAGEPVARGRAEIAEFRIRQADRIEQEVLNAIVARRWDEAEFVLIDLIALGGYEDRVSALRERLTEARMYGPYAPGEIILDSLADAGNTAPAVIVLSAGSFLMGSREDEPGRSDSEGPQHRVIIARGFALGVREVSVGQFRQFAESTGYRTRAELDESSWVYDDGSGRMTSRERINWRHDFQGRRARDDQPVLHVDWDDAQAYVQWLSRQTGQAYRLPTEAEWEYAIRAGSATPYWWGSGSPAAAVENLTGDRDASGTGRNWGVAFEDYDDGHWGPAPTGSFPANPFGVHDLAGNVSEWVADCWHDTYVRAPADGSAWINPGCGKRVVRGGYWASSPGQARSAARFSADANLRGARIGIRVARDL